MSWFDDRYLLKKLEQYSEMEHPLRCVKKTDEGYEIEAVAVYNGEQSRWRTILVIPGYGVAEDWKKMTEYLEALLEYTEGRRKQLPKPPGGLVRLK